MTKTNYYSRILGALGLGLVFASCDPGYPSFSGLYVQEGELVFSDPERASVVMGDFAVHFPQALSIRQYPFEKRTASDLAGTGLGVERSAEIAQSFEVGVTDVGSSGTLFSFAQSNTDGKLEHPFMKPALTYDAESDTQYDNNGNPIGPSCYFQYEAQGVISFDPDATTLTRALSGIYLRKLLEPSDSSGRSWIWSDVQSALWNPDDTQALLTIRLTRKLAYGNLGLCQYGGRTYPSQTESITLMARYVRREVYSSPDLRKQFSYREVREAAAALYSRERDAWPWIFDHDGTSMNLQKYFGAPKFP